ncbi:unnamed protein product [Mesocestoides corti]|nr:unnamed protein product [Mesocestoides corti]
MYLNRRRRANNSETTTEPYDIAMSLVGGDTASTSTTLSNVNWIWLKRLKLDKSTLLNVCKEIFQRLWDVSREMPEVHFTLINKFGRRRRLDSRKDTSVERGKENMPPPTPIMSSSLVIGKTEGCAMATVGSGFHGSIASPLPFHQTHYQSDISDGNAIPFGIPFIPFIRLTSASRNATPTIAGCVNHMSLELCLFAPFLTYPIP